MASGVACSEKVNQLHKVAVLCTRGESELLVFRQDRGGVQVPAGTVEFGEDLASAAARELQEEAGIFVQSVTALFSLEERGDTDERVVAEALPLRERPDLFLQLSCRRSVEHGSA